jgi:predicted nucleic acid-binding protein
VRLIVADTGPVNYLVLIGSIDVLPILFDSMILPSSAAVRIDAPGRSAFGAELDV